MNVQDVYNTDIKVLTSMFKRVSVTNVKTANIEMKQSER